MIEQAEQSPSLSGERLRERIAELGPWFHNIHLGEEETAPEHFLGDFPANKWSRIAPAIPQDLHGATVLDIGCNAGFYSLELKRRGAARVLGIDASERYLEQARFAASALELEIDFRHASVYEVDRMEGQFDIVLFMGLFYHLRYPLYALDKVVQKTAGVLVFQSLTRPGQGEETPAAIQTDYEFWDDYIFRRRGYPRMQFIEHAYAHDQTNWWVPNAPCVEAMLRSAGMRIFAHPEAETWICAPAAVKRRGRYIQALELDGDLW